MTALRALLAGVVDYAGMFPPAALDMAAAVREYDACRHGPHAWILGRFIVPLARLAELEEVAGDQAEPLPVSVLGHPAGATARHTVIGSAELKAGSVEDIRQAMESSPRDILTYFEIPVSSDPGELVAALAKAGAGAKVRTGGLTADMFPSSQDLARFLQACAAAKVPFKATAGLHHPLRSVHRFTYEPDSPAGVMHGFVNVFLAAALLNSGLYSGGGLEDAVRTLEERSPDAFRFEDAAVTWHSHRLTAQQIRAARAGFAISFGSCSFQEPIDDLKTLRWL
jgi:hypothetical protein